MKRVLMIALVLAAGLYADDASKKAKVEEYLRVVRVEETIGKSMDLMMDNIRSGMLQQALGFAAPPAEMKDLVEAFYGRLGGAVRDAISWEKIKPAYAKVYAEAFTEQELDGMIAFYKSPAGQALVTKQPEIMTKCSEIGQQRMRESGPELQKIMQEFIAEAAKKAPQKEKP